jgi:hypothetical protein
MTPLPFALQISRGTAAGRGAAPPEGEARRGRATAPKVPERGRPPHPMKDP